MGHRHQRAEGFVIDRLRDEAGLINRQGQHQYVEFGGLQPFQQVFGIALGDVQRHLRRQGLDARHQRRQQPGTDRVDHAETQWPGQRILAGGGDLGDAHRFGQCPFGLGHHLGADGRDADIAGTAFEQGNTEFLFKLLDRHRQRRLRHIALVRRAAEMALAGEGDDVAEFGQGHDR
jgi:hypothetical protein